MTRASDRRKRLALKVRIASEATLPSVKPETVRDILARESAAPMRGGAQDLQHNGIFGDAHKQIDLF